MTDFEKLMKLTETIQSQPVREFTQKFLEESPEYFRTVPASSSGKYHPKYCLGEGGLVRHTISATKILNHILDLEFMQKTFTPLQRDKMRSAIILHDTRKQGDGHTGHTVKNHEVLAAEAVNKFLNYPKTHIGQLILTHMGQWGKESPKNLPEFLVHLADYLASRKEIEVSI